MRIHRWRTGGRLALWMVVGLATASSATTLTATDTVMLADFADSSDAALRRVLREALRAALDESPYLNLIPDAAIEAAPGAASASVAAREPARLCQHVRARAYIIGVLTDAGEDAALRGHLDAIDCGSRAGLAHEEFTARQERLVDELGRAADRLRVELGEPRASVQRYSTTLSNATSASFAALDAWSAGLAVWRREGAAAALPLLQKAVEADPAFTAAIYDLGLAYRNSGQEERAR